MHKASSKAAGKVSESIPAKSEPIRPMTEAELEKVSGGAKDPEWRPDQCINAISDPYHGMKQASEYLKSRGIPKEHEKQIPNSFDLRTIKLEVAGKNTYGLRFYGDNASIEGRYLFETFSPLTNRQNLALPYEWNSMTGIQQFQVKEGTIMITGNAAAQPRFGNQYIGGARQWYINNLEDLIKCQ